MYFRNKNRFCAHLVFLFLGIAAALPTAFAQALATEFAAANRAYSEKKYTLAFSLYEKMGESGIVSSDIAYNMGNCCAQMQQVGKAILYYERCLAIDPFHADAAYNLSVVSMWSKDDITPIQPFFLIRWAIFIRDALNSTQWLIIGFSALFSMAIAVFFWLFGSDLALKKKGFFAAVLLLLSTPLPFWYAHQTRPHIAKTKNMAILQATEIVLHAAPDEESEDILRLHEGVKLLILDQINDWYKVELPNSEQGWLIESAVERI